MYFCRVIHAKKLALPAACIAFIIFLMLFSESSLKSARDGLNLWLGTVFPSLLPFLTVSEILRSTGLIHRLGKILEPVMRPLFNLPGCSSLAYVLGLVSGYPAGAKITCGLYKDGFLTKNEAERLLALSSNAGPLFITGVVANGIFRLPSIAALLLACHIFSGLLSGIITNILTLFRGGPDFQKFQTGKYPPVRPLPYQNAGTAFVHAITSSVDTLLMVGGFIIFFSVVINLLLTAGVFEVLASVVTPIFSLAAIPSEILKPFLGGVVEITAGIGMLGSSADIPVDFRMAATAFLLGWGGISVYFQIYGIALGEGLGTGRYIAGKLIHGVLACITTYAGFKLFLRHRISTVPASTGNVLPPVLNLSSTLLVSCLYMAVTLLVMFAATLLFGHKRHCGK